ncbi:MAG TPA: alpha/beta fold hydrolase [Acidimicrobiales bacterium]|nr:alpha/beta fold hydrolase [Acidimicrobiales bacterium]
MTTPILPGAEPYFHEGGAHGVLVLHGFTGNPSSVRSLAERFAGAGYTVLLPRLPGHGTSVEDLMTTAWDDWSQAALAAYDEVAAMCPHVLVAGLSMGGGLAAMIAEQRRVVGAVLINPLVTAPGADMSEGVRQLLEAGVETVDSIGSDVKKEGVAESSYAATPLGCVASLFAGIKDVEANLSKISAPCLVLSSREDHVVTSDNGDALVENVSGPIERVWLEDSFHVATIDNDQELVESSALAFAAKVFS